MRLVNERKTTDQDSTVRFHAMIVSIVGWLCAAIFSTQVYADVLERYSVRDSGVIGRSLSEDDLHWLDNERLIFVGWLPGESREEQGSRVSKIDLFVWNTSSGEVRRHAELSGHARLCLAKRYVRVQYERDGKLRVRHGDFGNEEDAALDVGTYKDGGVAVSPISCREYDLRWVRKRHGDRALPLLEPGEYLVRPAVDSTEPMHYLRNERATPIPLPIIPQRYVIYIPKYSAHLDAYIFNELRPVVGPESTARAWVLHRRGNVEEFSLPRGLWMASYVRAMPIKDGWMMTSNATAIGRRIDAAGVYVVRGEKAVRVIAGLPHAHAVSPDGCKVAASIDVELRREAQPVVRMIDTCSRRD